MDISSRFSRLHPLVQYITTRCAQLSCLMLTCALVTLVWSGSWTLGVCLSFEYAACTAGSACVVLFAGLFGGLLLEDILAQTL